MKTMSEWYSLGYEFSSEPVGLVRVSRTDGKSFYFFNPRFSTSAERAFNNMTTDCAAGGGPRLAFQTTGSVDYSSEKLFAFELLSIDQFDGLYSIMRAISHNEHEIRVLQAKIAMLASEGDKWMKQFTTKE